MVTTCVVVWIEISILCNPSQYNKVTTCVVVWIEIAMTKDICSSVNRHHLRGGVD